jgi:hypothetical protein
MSSTPLPVWHAIEAKFNNQTLIDDILREGITVAYKGRRMGLAIMLCGQGIIIAGYTRTKAVFVRIQ